MIFSIAYRKTPDVEVPIQHGRILFDYVDGFVSIDDEDERNIIAELNKGAGGTNDAREVFMGGDSFIVTNPYAGIPLGTEIKSERDLYSILRFILRPIEPPVYIKPTLSLTGTVPFSREIGENITTTFTPTFTQNDGGALEQYRLVRNAINIHTGTSAVPITETFQLTENRNYFAQADFAQGEIKEDSAGEPDDTGRIEAGTVTSNTVSYTPFRRAFYSALFTPQFPTDSDSVRALSQSLDNPQNGTQITVEVNAGQRGLVFCYPQSLRPPSSIIQVSLGLNVTSWFTEIAVPVRGANGFTAVMYRVLYLIPEFPYASSEVFRLTI